MPTTLTLTETAERHGVAKSSLSEAVHDDRPVLDMNLHRYAIIEDGTIKCFRFPSWYSFPDEEDSEEEETRYHTFEELLQAHSAFDRFKIETALRNGWPVDGFPIYAWVVRDDLGKWHGFEVPKSAPLDGPPQNMAADVPAPESGEKDAGQGDSPNEDALSGDDDPSDEDEAEDEADGG